MSQMISHRKLWTKMAAKAPDWRRIEPNGPINWPAVLAMKLYNRGEHDIAMRVLDMPAESILTLLTLCHFNIDEALEFVRAQSLGK